MDKPQGLNVDLDGTWGLSANLKGLSQVELGVGVTVPETVGSGVVPEPRACEVPIVIEAGVSDPGVVEPVLVSFHAIQFWRELHRNALLECY